jgi:hypothetical protein
MFDPQNPRFIHFDSATKVPFLARLDTQLAAAQALEAVVLAWNWRSSWSSV